jgi:hypothetical protein
MRTRLELHSRKGLVSMMEWRQWGIDSKHHRWQYARRTGMTVTRFAWWRQDLHAIELLRAHIGEWTITWMLDYWRVMCFTGYRLNHIISGTISTITGIHSKIVRLTSHEWWSIYGWFMTTFTPSYRGERPSFKHITLYQLCYWKVTRIYGLTQEEIKNLLTNPDPHIPSHHQVDPRIIKAYLTGAWKRSNLSSRTLAVTLFWNPSNVSSYGSIPS